MTREEKKSGNSPLLSLSLQKPGWTWRRSVPREECIALTLLDCTNGWTHCVTTVVQYFEKGTKDKIYSISASFDNCTLRLFEEGGGINILVDKVIIRSNIIYQLQSLKMKIGNSMLGDWQYISTGEVNLHGVQHEYVEIAVDSPTDEVNFLVDAKFRVT